LKNILITILILISIPVFPDNINVYFTRPGYKINSINPGIGLLKLIRQSRKAFYGAFYDIDLPELARELIIAHRRGVDIRLVTDDKNFSGSSIDALLKEGIPVITDNKSSLMHNKFAISDFHTIFTGSYNATKNGTFKNNNNAVIIDSDELAEIYLQEFQEMFGGHIFSNKQERGLYASLTKKYHVKLNDSDVNVYFSPDDNVERIILKRIKKAKKSIRFMYFSFTSKAVANELIKAHKKGIEVKGLMEKRGTGSRYSQYVKMSLEGIPVKLDRNRYIMHHKVIIIDDHRVITGSYNMSKNAAKRNDENILIIDNNNIAAKFIREFNRLYGIR